MSCDREVFNFGDIDRRTLVGLGCGFFLFFSFFFSLFLWFCFVFICFCFFFFFWCHKDGEKLLEKLDLKMYTTHFPVRSGGETCLQHPMKMGRDEVVILGFD